MIDRFWWWLRRLPDRFYWWLEWSTPYKCGCGHWVRSKYDARWHRATWGQQKSFCCSCWEKENKWDKGLGL